MIKKIMFIFIPSFLLFAQVNGAKYLIIVADDFYNAVLPLAKWKHKKGIPTKVIKVSQIGNYPHEIKSYIDSAYSNWEVKPEYVLLVGAVEHLVTGGLKEGIIITLI
ncbi:MAG: C25 family cysteine peptidase [candidate division WOR-3 bacterium]